MEVSTYIMRVGETGTVYKGYRAVVDSELLERCYIYPLEGGIGIACGEDAVIQGEALNRAVYGSGGEFKTVLAGNLAAVRYEGRCISSIREEDIAMIEKTLKPIERIAYGKVFLREANRLPEWREN